MKISEDLYEFLWLNPTANNCNAYFINGKKRILIDPGHYQLFGHVKEHLSRLSLSPEDIDIVLVTHGHPDHIEGVRTFVDTSTLIAISSVEMRFIKAVAPHYGEVLGVPNFEPDILLQEGDLKIGDLTFQVIHTPGHSPGSLCVYWPEKKVLFTGDVVFNQGVGRIDVPGGNGEELKESIRKISRLEVDHLLPGHGDVISGRDDVKANFAEIERVWFAYL
ncbi:MAG: MBL fold metallo-hydrolase [Desulfobacteraceae bacterium]|jgi:glyoxylase-like metal-dependent hydrolase (beta-lactamase superfamily II)